MLLPCSCRVLATPCSGCPSMLRNDSNVLANVSARCWGSWWRCSSHAGLRCSPCAGEGHSTASAHHHTSQGPTAPRFPTSSKPGRPTREGVQCRGSSLLLSATEGHQGMLRQESGGVPSPVRACAIRPPAAGAFRTPPPRASRAPPPTMTRTGTGKRQAAAAEAADALRAKKPALEGPGAALAPPASPPTQPLAAPQGSPPPAPSSVNLVPIGVPAETATAGGAGAGMVAGPAVADLLPASPTIPPAGDIKTDVCSVMRGVIKWVRRTVVAAAHSHA